MSEPPNGWVTIPFEQLGTWQGGGTPSKANQSFWTNGSIPWVSPKDMKREKIDSAQDLITVEAIQHSAANLIPPGSLLFVTRSGILKHSLPVSANSTPVAINQDIKALTPSPGINTDFLRYQIVSRESEILSATSRAGTTVESIDFRALKNVVAYLPSTTEQERIVQKLEPLLLRTKGIENELAAIPRLVEDYRRAFLKRAFSRSLTSPRRQSHAGSQPWRKCSLGEIAEIQSGITLGKRRPQDVRLISRPYLRVANVQRGRLDLADVRTIKVTEKEARRLYLEPGDILMNEGGDRDKLGRGWVWEGQVKQCIHQNHVFRVRLHERSFPSKYISYFANEFGREHFFAHGTQTTNLASISKSKLAALVLPLPPIEEAIEIVEIIERTFRLLDQLLHKCSLVSDSLPILERRILAKAFRGELVRPLAGADAGAARLLQDSQQNLVAAKAKGSHNRSTKGRLSVKTQLLAELENWPRDGRTFEELYEAINGDYEQLKRELFELLGGANPVLRQRFDEKNRIMRLLKVD